MAGTGPAAGPAPGSVTQVSGKNGCYTDTGASSAGAKTCRAIRGGSDATTVAISPDGRFAYVVGYGLSNDPDPALGGPVLAAFSRNTKTGVLTQLRGKAGCLSQDGASQNGLGQCTKARDLGSGDAISIAISSNGRFLYVASQYDDSGTAVGGIVIFRRSLKTGRLLQLAGTLGCITADGSSNKGPGTCAVGREVDDISAVHITPDQKYLYASNYDSQPYSGIAIFRRNLNTGALRQLAGREGCITDNGMTPQSGGKQVCRAMPNVGSPWDVATPGNKFVYIPDRDNDLVQAFRRDAQGGLVPLTGKGACVSDSGSSPLGAGSCVAGRGLFDVERAVPSQNGAFIYTNGFSEPSPIAVLDRNQKTGLLSQRTGRAACVSADGTTGDNPALHCRIDPALGGGYAGALSPDGKTLYYAEYGNGGGTLSSLAVFRVNKVSGSFSPLPGKLGCVTYNGSDAAGAGKCKVAPALQRAYQVAIAPGGVDVYVAVEATTGSSFGGIDFLRAVP
jgi:DNA-binding beta-propeller fold protein YncE